MKQVHAFFTSFRFTFRFHIRIVNQIDLYIKKTKQKLTACTTTVKRKLTARTTTVNRKQNVNNLLSGTVGEILAEQLELIANQLNGWTDICQTKQNRYNPHCGVSRPLSLVPKLL